MGSRSHNGGYLYPWNKGGGIEQRKRLPKYPERLLVIRTKPKGKRRRYRKIRRKK